MEEKTDSYVKPEELEVINLIHFVSDNKLDKDPRIKALLTSLAHNPEDKERKAQLVRMIKPRMIRNLLSPNPFMPYPEDDEVDGEIRLGLCAETLAVFGLNLGELMQGTLIVGRPGSGKTTLTYNIIQRANDLGIHCLILDIKKDYRHLIRKLPDTLVFRTDDENFRWNPLQAPEGVGRVNLITAFADITSEANFVQDGTNNYIVEHLNRLFGRLGQPTVMDLYNAISRDDPKLVTRTARYRESAMNRLASIIVKMGKAFSYKNGYKIERLLDDYNIVVEIDNLGHKGKIYLTPLILSHVFQYRIANNLRGVKQKPVLVIVDEGNEIFDKNLERMMGGLTLTSMVREAREFQLGIICSCQVPEAISDTLKNVYTRVLLSLSEGSNLRDFAGSMGLSKEQIESNFSLAPGQAIIRLAGRYDKPFLAQFIDYPLEKNVSSEEIMQHMKPLLEKINAEYGIGEEQETEASAEVKTEKKEEKLTLDEKKFLFAVDSHQYKMSLTEIYPIAGFKKCKGTKISQSCRNKKLIDIIEITKGKGVSKYPVLLADAYKILDIEERKFEGKGCGYEHLIWQHLIAEHFKSEKAKIEEIINKKSIDVTARDDGRLIAIEVAVSSANEKTNIEKDVDLARADLVIIGCRDKKVLEEVNKIIAGVGTEKQSKTKALLLKEIINLSLKELV
jgi:KaiC/GvpD/RAD55 family RecA-like ATPase